MKRIHFTAQDLMRTRVAATIGVAAETFDSLKLLRKRDGSLAFRRWQVSVQGRLDEQMRPLAALMTPQGPDLDVMSLAGKSTSIEEAVDTLLGAPPELIRIELENVEFHPAHRSWVQNLIDGDREAWLQVTTALRACHSLTVAPYWGNVRAHLSEVRAAYVSAMAEGGVEHLLNLISGTMLHWRPPVLEIRHSYEGDFHLNGRGLVIAPTVFSAPQAELLKPALDPAQAPVLAVPTVTDALVGTLLWEGAGASTGASLDDLLGGTRAAVLREATGSRGTTDLARRLSISPATVSHHTSVLRNAGLLATRREGKAVVHTVTSLGMALLESGSGRI